MGAVERSVIVPFGPQGLVAGDLAAVEIKESQERDVLEDESGPKSGLFYVLQWKSILFFVFF